VGIFRRPSRALVGSASRLPGLGSNAAAAQTREEGWQWRALRIYDTVGEVRYCSQFYARMLARITIFPARIEDDGQLSRIDDGPEVEILSRIQEAGGGRERLQYDYGRLMFVTGEGALFVNAEGPENWRFLWKGELIKEDNEDITWRKNAAGEKVEAGTAWRFWTPHPRHSDLADSPLRPCLDIADELVVLTAAVHSAAVSRVLNGMLLLPSQVSPPPPEGPDEEPEQSPFLQMFTAHIQAQKENPASAEAKVPFVLEADYDYLDQVRWMPMHDPATDYLEKDLRIEAIKRLGLGLDMPPEALEGFSNTNHWAAQQILWDMWRTHGVPMADQFTGDLASIYLRPILIADGMSEDEVRRRTVGYDDSRVVLAPDMSAIADEAMDRVAIGFAGYRKMKGIPEEYAPSQEEIDLVAGIKMRDPVVAGLEKAAPPVRGPQPGADVSQNGQSNTPPVPTQGRVVSRQEARTASILGAAHHALATCRSRAGARLQSQVKRPGAGGVHCPECQQTIADIPKGLIASALGAEMVYELGMRDPIAMVAGGTADFSGILTEWGISAQDAAVLCERIEAHAAKTLFDASVPDLPPGFAAHVEHALEMTERTVA
jgi:hypothetical protein